MRKLALLAMLALVVGFVPMASAGGQVEAQADGDVHFINGIAAAEPPNPIDVCEGTETLASGLANGDAADVTLPGGVHAISVALVGTGDDCSDEGDNIPIGSINVAGGQNQTMIIGPAPAAGNFTYGVNDTSTTPADTTRLTLRHGFLGFPQTIGICIDGEVVEGTQTAPGAQNQVEVPSGAVDLTLFVEVAGGCQESEPATLAACTNLVFNIYAEFTGAEPAPGVDNELFIVGCELPVSDQNVSQFCLAINPGLQAAAAAIDALFAGVNPANTDTYPPPSEVEAVVDQVNAALAAGDATVPDTIRPQWEILTAGLRDFVAGMTAASFDLVTVGEEGVAEIVDGLNEPPSPETAAATEVLTEYFLANCLISGEPTFTG